MANDFTKRTTLGQAPIQRKKVIKKGGPAYSPPSVIPGVKHFVEGRSDLTYKDVEWRTMRHLGVTTGKLSPQRAR